MDIIPEPSRIGIAEAALPDPRPAAECSALRTLPCVSSIHEHSLFTLGPVYYFAAVDRDLVADFISETAPFDLLSFQYPRNFTRQLGDWNHILQAAPDSIFPALSAFLLGLTLTRTTQKQLFRIARRDITFQNVNVSVFVPRGNQFSVDVLTDGVCFEVVAYPPDADAVKEAEVLFSVL